MTITMLIIIALCPDGYDDGEKKSAYNFLVEVQTWGETLPFHSDFVLFDISCLIWNL